MLFITEKNGILRKQNLFGLYNFLFFLFLVKIYLSHMIIPDYYFSILFFLQFLPSYYFISFHSYPPLSRKLTCSGMKPSWSCFIIFDVFLNFVCMQPQVKTELSKSLGLLNSIANNVTNEWWRRQYGLAFDKWKKKESSKHLAPFYDIRLNTDWTQINQLSKKIPLWWMFHRESLFYVTVQREDGKYRFEHVAFRMSSYSYQ